MRAMSFISCCTRRGTGRTSQSRRYKRWGASAVEFAVVAPIFFLMVFGMIEYGRMIMVQQILTNATREGARVAVLDGATSSGVKTIVVTYLNNSSIPGATVSDVDVNPDPATAGFGQPVTVTITIPFSQVSWLPSPMYLGAQNVAASSVMRRESVQ